MFINSRLVGYKLVCLGLGSDVYKMYILIEICEIKVMGKLILKWII